MYGINSIGGTYMFSRSRLVGLEFEGAILGNGGRWVVRVVVVVWKIVRVLARSVCPRYRSEVKDAPSQGKRCC